MSRSLRNSLAVAATLAGIAFAFAASAGAQTPPRPDFFWTYGRVAQDGQNIVPAQQSVLALVNGRVCGQARTAVAGPEPGNPAEDVGKTVYVVDVLADGGETGQRRGCGKNGDPVLLYFPDVKRVAVESPPFESGIGRRNNLTLGPPLGHPLTVVLVASDGVN